MVRDMITVSINH